MTTSGRCGFAWHGERAVSWRAALATAAGLALSLSRAAPAAVPAVDMAEVRRLARDPVETIFAGVAIGRVSDVDYWKAVRGSKKPVVVIFYANQDERSRNLATLARYLALESTRWSGSAATALPRDPRRSRRSWRWSTSSTA
jgi:hypothetical protein